MTVTMNDGEVKDMINDEEKKEEAHIKENISDDINKIDSDGDDINEINRDGDNINKIDSDGSDDDKKFVKNKKKNNEEMFDRSNHFDNFDNIMLDVRLRKALLYLFKYQHPTIIQKMSICKILNGNDVIISSKTGSGKTMAYLIPVIHNLIKLNLNEKDHLKFFYKCIIICPTEELCLQIYEVTKKLCSYLKDIVTVNHNVNNTFYDHPTILISTPKNLCTHIIEKKKKNNLDILMNLKILILDEADVLHTQEFQSYLKTLTSYLPKKFNKKYQIVMASATLKRDILDKTKLFLHNPIYITLEQKKESSFEKKKNITNDTNVHISKKGEATKNNIDDQRNEKKTNYQKFTGKAFYYLYKEELIKYIYLYNLIKNRIIPYKSIIFTTTIHDAYKIKIFLTYLNVSSSILNPNHPILIRQNIISAFNNSKFHFLICPQYEKNNMKHVKGVVGANKMDNDYNDEEEDDEEEDDEEEDDEEDGDDNNDDDNNDDDNNDDSDDNDNNDDSDDNDNNDDSDDNDNNDDSDDNDNNDNNDDNDNNDNSDDENDVDDPTLNEPLSDNNSCKTYNTDDENEKTDNTTKINEEKDFLYSRGLDFYDVKCVVNFDMPSDLETFIHRIGRTCRLNNKGKCISFVNELNYVDVELLQTLIEDKNICSMIKKDIQYNIIEKYRYRVESTLNKCTSKKIKLFIQKEILYQSLKSKELKDFFNTNVNEKRKINKIIKHFNKAVIPQKLIKDRNQSIFLNKSKVKNKVINKNNKNNKNDDNIKPFALKKNNGLVITEQGYESQLTKEPEREVADPSRLPPLCGQRLRNYMYLKYIKGKKNKNGNNSYNKNNSNNKKRKSNNNYNNRYNKYNKKAINNGHKKRNTNFNR
ncbi:DEAD/DEAH box ATP-dependent RNA helicase, putative [Plasmodium sp. DRC-Itaito]|nr:DEAD/DEAH box ATP-dependent RNA helicase, putative [Plasmodium sp. DRC-Itaito]